MVSFEDGTREIDVLLTDYTTDILVRGALTEADTRAKIIDRILLRVLGWQEQSFTREERTESGFVDYVLRHPHPVLVIEAKRRDFHFVLPLEQRNRSYSTETLIRAHDQLASAIRQARNYADENGIEYACVSNGAQWILFQAITRGKPWQQGRAVVFRSLEDLRQNFIEFWNVLSAESVGSGSLAATLQASGATKLTFARALQSLAYADAPLERNPYAPELQALITAVFQDLGGWREPELLKRCYVWERETKTIQKTVESTTSSALPNFAQRSGFRTLVLSQQDSGDVDEAFLSAVRAGRYGTSILLLGSIGSGKTTLLQRILNITAQDDVRARSAIIYVPFTDANPDPSSVPSFVRDKVLSELESRHPDVD
jgi:hypothetical protein